MPVITLPDASQRQYPHPVSVHDVPADIDPGLANAALAGAVEGNVVDSACATGKDADPSIVRERADGGLGVLRPPAAHRLAEAVEERVLGARVTRGPVTEGGLYYGLAYARH